MGLSELLQCLTAVAGQFGQLTSPKEHDTARTTQYQSPKMLAIMTDLPGVQAYLPLSYRSARGTWGPHRPVDRSVYGQSPGASGPDGQTLWPGPGRDVVLECVVNISEGRDAGTLAILAQACGPRLLDLHADPTTTAAVLTLAGEDRLVTAAVRDLARQAVRSCRPQGARGAHPRFGALDVVPWVALEGWPVRDAPAGTAGAERAVRRDATSSRCGLQPSWRYRSLPMDRSAHCLRSAGRPGGRCAPISAPDAPHPTAGAVAVGWRP